MITPPLKTNTPVRRIIFRLCCFGFFFDLVFIYAVDKLLFLDRGLSLVQIALLMSLWAAANLLFEVPSGILADKWNRRYLLITSAAARALLCVVWFFSNDFLGFLLGFVFLAISQASLSGTIQAYLYDSLAIHGREKQFERFWGRIEATRSIGLFCAWTVGGLVSTVSFSPALLLSFGSGLICVIFAYLLPNVAKTKTIETNSFRHLKQTLLYAIGHKMILRVLLLTAIVRSSYVVIDEYWAVYFSFIDIPPAQFGFLVGVSTLAGGVAGLLAHRFANRPWKAIYTCTLIFAATLLAASFSNAWPIIVAMLALELTTSLMYVLTEGIVQKFSAQNQRATTSSIVSLLKEFGIVTGIIFGFIIEKIDLPAGYLFFAIFILMFFPISWILTIFKRGEGFDFPRRKQN
jgi:MFS family permease